MLKAAKCEQSTSGYGKVGREWFYYPAGGRKTLIGQNNTLTPLNFTEMCLREKYKHIQIEAIHIQTVAGCNKRTSNQQDT